MKQTPHNEYEEHLDDTLHDDFQKLDLMESQEHPNQLNRPKHNWFQHMRKHRYKDIYKEHFEESRDDQEKNQ